MIELRDIHKSYGAGEDAVQALRGVSLCFGEKGLVSVVGPSGCGKSTLLNIIGGLDRYDSGDILVDGQSTKEYADADWDSYRNHRIGFVFQSYSLIQHLSVLDNVVMSLTLSGSSPKEKKQKAQDMLRKVGLGDKFDKRPSQLSGGQMQRVAIARALINEPDIVLCDEPTGALDSKTSKQIMDLLKEISLTRLVVMVTHNLDIAKEYSTRVVSMLDGVIGEDSAPESPTEIETEAIEKPKSTSMSFLAALKSSAKNLLTKKGRTIVTSIAGSIGIVGIGLVLSLSTGINAQVAAMESDALAGFPISIASQTTTTGADIAAAYTAANADSTFPEGDEYYAHDSSADQVVHENLFTDEFLEYLKTLDPSTYNSLSYSYGVGVNFAYRGPSSYGVVSAGGSDLMTSIGLGGSLALFEIPDSKDFILDQYDVLAGEYPAEKTDLAFVVDSSNHLEESTLSALGIPLKEKYSSADLLGRKFRVLANDDYYQESNGIYSPRTDYDAMYESSSSASPFAEVKCILRVKESASSSFLSTGLGYPSILTEYLLETDASSAVVAAQEASPETNVLDGQPFGNFSSYKGNMSALGGDDTPKSISIYPKSFDDKGKIKEHINAYNVGKDATHVIVYTDLAESITSTLSQVVDIVTIVLSAIAAISLVVSSVMIAIIIYVSVVERTQEIGIMRALGARKKDIARIFSMEAVSIGFVAGLIGVITTYLMDIPIGLVVGLFIGGSFSVVLPPHFALLLLLISVLLTFVAGIFPSMFAAKKDPVIALRDK
ncbi:MAG: ATP-binding cassette domain-containing protein [Bacilli bacterium]|nr:ATP-binding cassette domain-containing protein [Bacilli bacterium]